MSLFCAVAGAAGSGKTTLGMALARRISATAIDLDSATGPLLTHLGQLTGAGDDLDHQSLRGPVRDARYQTLHNLAADNTGIGRDVVAIAPFSAELADPQTWQRWTDLADRVVLIWVQTAPAVIAARRALRGLPRDRNAGDLLAHWRQSPRSDHLRADGAANPETEANRLAELLGR